MVGDNSVDDGEPKPSASILAGCKGLEYINVLRHSWTIVYNLNRKVLSQPLAPQLHMPVGAGGLNGVAHKVDEHLL